MQLMHLVSARQRALTSHADNVFYVAQITMGEGDGPEELRGASERAIYAYTADKKLDEDETVFLYELMSLYPDFVLDQISHTTAATTTPATTTTI